MYVRLTKIDIKRKRLIVMKSKIIIAVIMGILLCGCVSNSIVMDKEGNIIKQSSWNQNANGPLWISELEDPIEGHAMIVFFRKPIKDKIVDPEKLYVNGKFITDMKQYGFYPLHIKAGHYTFTLGSGNPKNVKYKDIQVISGEIKSGDYFHVEIDNYVEDMGRFSADAPGFFYAKGDLSTNKNFSAYKQTDDPLCYYIDYRLSATKKKDMVGLVKLKQEKIVNTTVIKKQSVLDGISGFTEGIENSSIKSNELLKNGLAGVAVMVIPKLIEKSITGEYTDDYLEYIGTTNGYTMDYLID